MNADSTCRCCGMYIRLVDDRWLDDCCCEEWDCRWTCDGPADGSFEECPDGYRHVPVETHCERAACAICDRGVCTGEPGRCACSDNQHGGQLQTDQWACSGPCWDLLAEQGIDGEYPGPAR